MKINISHETDTPLYRQIFSEIKLGIVNGDLKQGEILPSIRQLSKELELSVITVKNAYAELEHKGYIVTRQGKGCYVSTIDLEKEFNLSRVNTEKKLKNVIKESRSLGLNKEEIREIFNDLIKTIPNEKINKENQIAS